MHNLTPLLLKPVCVAAIPCESRSESQMYLKPGAQFAKDLKMS